jgi:hypothetical protein
MTDEAEATEPEVPTSKLRIGIVAQLEPVGRYLNPVGHPLAGTDLEQYTKDLTHYFAENLSKFADPRGGDVFLHVVVQCDGESNGQEFRSGHYVHAKKETPMSEPTEESDERADD